MIRLRQNGFLHKAPRQRRPRKQRKICWPTIVTCRRNPTLRRAGGRQAGALTEIVAELRASGERSSMDELRPKPQLITDHLAKSGHELRLIYGETPTEMPRWRTRNTRADIRTFLRRDSGVDILVANPAACAESISLHQVLRPRDLLRPVLQLRPVISSH